MRSRPSFWIALCLLLLAGVWFFWPAGDRRAALQNSAAPDLAASHLGATAPSLAAAG